jgi:hypothetical protein
LLATMYDSKLFNRLGTYEMATTIEDKIKSASEKLEKLKADKRRKEARIKALGSKAARASDTRKKILLGAVVLANIAEGKLDKTMIYKLLADGLVRNPDRALFDLPALPPEFDVDTGKNTHA